MKILSFYKTIALISLILVILIGLFISLNLSSKPRISSIQFISKTVDETNNSLKSISDAQIRVYFSRPMYKSELTDKVILTPADTEFSANWFGNGFVINFKQALSNDTEYVVKVDSNALVDNYGEKVSDDISIKFKTKPAVLAYIEKIENSTSEKIVSYNIASKEKKTVFSSKTIKLFQNIEDIYAIVTSDGNKDNLIIYDYANLRIIKDFELSSVNISNIEADPYNRKFAFSMQQIDDKEKYFVPTSSNDMYLLYLDDLEFQKFSPLNTEVGVLDLKFNNDYSGMIFKLPDSLYYVADIENPDNLSTIGKYLHFGNFSKDGSKALFLEYDPLAEASLYQYLVTIDSDREKVQITNGKTPIIDPQFFNKSNDIYFANYSQELVGTKGIYKLSIINESKEINDLFKVNDISIEAPIASSNDSYIAAETFTSDELLNYENLRNFGFQTKPWSGEIVIIDLKTDEIILDDLTGISPIFIQ